MRDYYLVDSKQYSISVKLMYKINYKSNGKWAILKQGWQLGL